MPLSVHSHSSSHHWRFSVALPFHHRQTRCRIVHVQWTLLQRQQTQGTQRQCSDV